MAGTDVGVGLAQSSETGRSVRLEFLSGLTGYRGDLSDFNRNKAFLGYPYGQARVSIDLNSNWAVGLMAGGGRFPRTGSPGLRYPLPWQDDTQPARVASSPERYLTELAFEWRPTTVYDALTPFIRMGGHVVWGSSPNSYTSVHEMGGGPSMSTGATIAVARNWSLMVEGTLRSTFPDAALDGYVDPSRSAYQRSFDLSGAVMAGVRFRVGDIFGSRPTERGLASTRTSGSISVSELALPAPGDSLSSNPVREGNDYRQQMICQETRRRADELYRSGRYVAARDTLASCLEADGVSDFGTVRALRLVALTHLAQNELGRARTAIAEILRLLPSYRANRVQDIPQYVDLVAQVRERRDELNSSTADSTESIP